MTTEVRCVSFSNAPPLMDVTLFGIITEIRDGLSANATSPIDKTPNGNSTETRAVSSKEASPIEVTLEGMTTEVNDVACKNALAPIDVTLSGMSTDVKEVSLQNA